MAIVRKWIYPGMELTPEQIAEVRALDERPIVFDEECPERSYEELMELYEKSKEWRAAREKKRQQLQRQPLSIMVSPAIIEAAKKYGEGALSRLLDLAIRDEALLKRCL